MGGFSLKWLHKPSWQFCCFSSTSTGSSLDLMSLWLYGRSTSTCQCQIAILGCTTQPRSTTGVTSSGICEIPWSAWHSISSSSSFTSTVWSSHYWLQTLTQGGSHTRQHEPVFLRWQLPKTRGVFVLWAPSCTLQFQEAKGWLLPRQACDTCQARGKQRTKLLIEAISNTCILFLTEFHFISPFLCVHVFHCFECICVSCALHLSWQLRLCFQALQLEHGTALPVVACGQGKKLFGNCSVLTVVVDNELICGEL